MLLPREEAMQFLELYCEVLKLVPITQSSQQFQIQKKIGAETLASRSAQAMNVKSIQIGDNQP